MFSVALGSFILATVLSSVNAFYLPGVAPHSYIDGEEVELKVNKLRLVRFLFFSPFLRLSRFRLVLFIPNYHMIIILLSFVSHQVVLNLIQKI
jgi:hypothetical protein